MVQNKLPLINSTHGSETRNIINELIKLFNQMGYTYDEALKKAHNILDEAQKKSNNILNEAERVNSMNENVQQQISTLIIESGTSDAEVLQARIDADGNEYNVLKDRLDESDAELAGTVTKSNVANISRFMPKEITNMTISESGWQGIVRWMDSNGVIYYSDAGTELYRSDDDGNTKTLIHEFTGNPITAVRSLDNGELIVALNNSTGVPGEVYVSASNQSVWTKVITMANDGCYVNQAFSIDVKDNNVIIGEYGIQGEAQLAYYSEDYGQTFTMVFDLANYAPIVSNAHIHGVLYDEYWDRIWINHGDGNYLNGNNCGLYYSDDKGVTWVKAPISTQLLNMHAFEDCVIFGSDAPPNGIYIYHRESKEVTPIVDLQFKLNDKEYITHLPQFFYQRDKQSPLLISWSLQTEEETDLKTKFITATMDGKHYEYVWIDNIEHKPIQPFSVVAPTNDSKLIGTMNGDNRQASPSNIRGTLEIDDSLSKVPIKSSVTNGFIDARRFGIQGNGTDESVKLAIAIVYCSENKKTLHIPKDMTISVRDARIENVDNFGLLCEGNIKLIASSASAGTYGLHLINCNNIDLYDLGFVGNELNHTNQTRLNQIGLYLIDCDDIRVGNLRSDDFEGVLLKTEGVNKGHIKTIRTRGNNRGSKLFYIHSAEDVTIDSIISDSYAIDNAGNTLIQFTPLSSSDVIKNFRIKDLYIRGMGGSDIYINNPNSGTIDNVEIDKFNIIKTKTYTSRIAVNLTAGKNIKVHGKINVENPPATRLGDGLQINGVDGFDIDLEIKDFGAGARLGNGTLIQNGKFNGLIKDIHTGGLYLGKLSNVKFGDFEIRDCALNGGSTNISYIAGVTNLTNVTWGDCTFGLSNTTGRNINLGSEVYSNVLFENCDFTEWDTVARMLAINVAGVTRRNNKGLNYLPSSPDSQYWNVGEMVWNTDPTTGEYLGWVCLVAGSVSSTNWKGFGLIE